MDIPKKHIDFCRAVARLARQSGLYKIDGTFRPGYKDEWAGTDITFHWESGRHGEDEGKLGMSAQRHIFLTVDPKEQEP